MTGPLRTNELLKEWSRIPTILGNYINANEEDRVQVCEKPDQSGRGPLPDTSLPNTSPIGFLSLPPAQVPFSGPPKCYG